MQCSAYAFVSPKYGSTCTHLHTYTSHEFNQPRHTVLTLLSHAGSPAQGLNRLSDNRKLGVPQSVAGQLPPETHRHSHTETHPIPRERIHAIAPDGVVSVGSTAHPCGRPRTTKHCNSNCCFTQAHANTSQRIWTLDAHHMLITYNNRMHGISTTRNHHAIISMTGGTCQQEHTGTHPHTQSELFSVDCQVCICRSCSNLLLHTIALHRTSSSSQVLHSSLPSAHGLNAMH